MPLFAFAKNGKDYREPLPVYSLHHESRDTIDFRNRLLQNDRKLIIYCANWCNPCYKEFNLLYSQGIIDKLKENDVHLIIVADKSPCLKLNHHLIDGDWNEHILQDFEVYYDVNGSFIKSISDNTTFPYCLLMNNTDVIAESTGLKEDYSFLLDAVQKINSNRCKNCNGTGRVKPNPHGGPDDSVGICP